MVNLNKDDVYRDKHFQLYKQSYDSILVIGSEETKSLLPHMNPVNSQGLGTYVFH